MTDERIVMTENAPTKYEIEIPTEDHAGIQWEEHKMPAFCAVNKALVDFKHKEVFGWHLAIVIENNESTSDGQPTPEEKQVIDGFCNELAEQLKADNNAMFLARSMWNGCYQLFFRVFDPEVADAILQKVIDSEQQPREFQYHMEQDKEWKFAGHYLKPFMKTEGH
jgi:hypothetical protein